MVQIKIGQEKKREELNSFELEALKILSKLGGKADVQTIAYEMKRNFDYVYRICSSLEKGGYIELDVSSGIAQITSKGEEELAKKEEKIKSPFLCPKCHAVFSGKDTFCPGCGKSLNRECPNCGYTWRFYQKYYFCPTCHAELPKEPPPATKARGWA